MARPRKLDHDATLDAIVDEFWGSSYAATSTEDLCARTGLSRSSLYNAFQSKPASYRLALARYGDAKAAQRQHYAQLPGTGRDVLRHLMSEVVAEQQGQSDRRSCLVVNACVELGGTDPEIAGLARQSLAAFESLLQQVIVRGQRDGSVRADLPAQELARTVHAVINGLQVRDRVAADPAESARVISTVLALV